MPVPAPEPHVLFCEESGEFLVRTDRSPQSAGRPGRHDGCRSRLPHPGDPRTRRRLLPQPLPLLPLRIPKSDLGIEQQSDEKIKWLQDAKLGMFIHWGVYSGPAKGEWYMENSAVTPENYRKYFTDSTGDQFTASAYKPADWAQLAKDMGAKYTVLTTRHHEGFALWPSTTRTPSTPVWPRCDGTWSASTSRPYATPGSRSVSTTPP